MRAFWRLVFGSVALCYPKREKRAQNAFAFKIEDFRRDVSKKRAKKVHVRKPILVNFA